MDDIILCHDNYFVNEQIKNGNAYFWKSFLIGWISMDTLRLLFDIVEHQWLGLRAYSFVQSYSFIFDKTKSICLLDLDRDSDLLNKMISIQAGYDRFVWKLNFNVLFSVKNAYTHFYQINYSTFMRDLQQAPWKIFWHFKILFKMKNGRYVKITFPLKILYPGGSQPTTPFVPYVKKMEKSLIIFT